MKFSRQEYWSGLLFPSPGDLPNPRDQTGIMSPALTGRFFTNYSICLSFILHICKIIFTIILILYGFPGGPSGKNTPANAGGLREAYSTPGLGRSPGEGNSNLLQYSCLENSMDGGAYRATVHGVSKSQTQLITHTHTYIMFFKLQFSIASPTHTPPG